jgi:hypothetical protein
MFIAMCGDKEGDRWAVESHLHSKGIKVDFFDFIRSSYHVNTIGLE